MKHYLTLFIVLLLSACKAGSGDDLDEQGRPLEETPVVDITPTDPIDDVIKPTLTSIQEKVFTPICASCHGGANPAAGQDLSSIDNTINNLINIDSSNPLFKRVLPGSSADSYLYLKITGDSRAGSRMPLGQPALDEDAIIAIKQWIDDGALVPESSSKPAKVSRVTRMDKINKASIIAKNNSAKIDYVWRMDEHLVVVIWFSQAMEFTGLTKKEVLVTVSDNIYGSNTSDWILENKKLTINIVNDHVLQLNISDLHHDVKHINIQLNNTSIATIMSNSGLQFDGDSDGLEGGVFTYDIAL